ncbi:MAG: hypothetical protein A2X13_14575 [Bacteroidetes bacterium GWC2_33_15]|nr:MAG: hypothetical protein A2X10_12620 [Bacteroidetes bacterium GWA2_33_15]OFX50097.1 MAG: hypothetical protein A2X13_14575 [Bacteroidetes bacterium GWC2_33_15]OFX65250.1 MAG: hypothetical protein A2X15_04150 [Bacteroidetes bacterium GWB2_32_14]
MVKNTNNFQRLNNMSYELLKHVTDIDVIVTINGKHHHVQPKPGVEKDDMMNKMVALRLLLDSHFINIISEEELIKFVNSGIKKSRKRKTTKLKR